MCYKVMPPQNSCLHTHKHTYKWTYYSNKCLGVYNETVLLFCCFCFCLYLSFNVIELNLTFLHSFCINDPQKYKHTYIYIFIYIYIYMLWCTKITYLFRQHKKGGKWSNILSLSYKGTNNITN